MNISRFWQAFVLSLILPGMALAQNARVSGVVTDAVTGQPLPGVTWY